MINLVLKQLMNETQQLVDAIVEGMKQKKGEQIVVADLSNIGETICKYFVICQGNSPAQVDAICDAIGETAQKMRGVKPIAVVGRQNAEWVAMDYSDVIVHIFQPLAREFYDLEHLWADARLKHIEEDNCKEQKL